MARITTDSRYLCEELKRLMTHSDEFFHFWKITKYENAFAFWTNKCISKLNSTLFLQIGDFQFEPFNKFGEFKHKKWFKNMH